MKKHKGKIIAGFIIIATLVFAYWYGGDSPSLRGWEPDPSNSDKVAVNNTPYQNYNQSQPAKSSNSTTERNQNQNETIIQNTENIVDSAISSDTGAGISDKDKNQKENNKSPITTDEPHKNESYSDDNAIQNKPDVPNQSNKKHSQANEMVTDDTSGKDVYMTDPVPTGKPLPVEPQDIIISDKELTCILSVRCDTILDNLSWLDEDKVDIVPKDGVIFAEKTVTFYEGESVFNVLVREMKQNKIHMEFENVPIYNSAYIEGISNLYEFDCGELSGWMYKVNGWFPNYGCSRYLLKNGDKIEWLYTCDLGADIGAGYTSSQKP